MLSSNYLSIHDKDFLIFYVIRGSKALEVQYFDYLYIKRRTILKSILEEKMLGLMLLTIFNHPDFVNGPYKLIKGRLL